MGNWLREYTPNIRANAAAGPDHPPSSSPPPPSPPLSDVVPASFDVAPASSAATSVETSLQGQTPVVDASADYHPASTCVEKQTKRGDKRKRQGLISTERFPPEITRKHPELLCLDKRMVERPSEGRMIEKDMGKTKPVFPCLKHYAMASVELNKIVRESGMGVLKHMEALTNTKVMDYLIGKQEEKKIKLLLRESVMEIVSEEDKGYKGSSEECGGEEGEDEHKEEAKEGDDDNDASRVCAMLEEDEKAAKNVDDVDDKYSSEIESRVMGLKKYIREDNCSYIPLGKERVDHETWASYYKQIDDSEGFDIKSYPGNCFMARIVPLRGIQNDPEYIQWGIKSLEDYNGKKGDKYQFHKLVSVNSRVADGQYLYITFQAKRPGNVYNVVTFQSLVHHGFTKDEVIFCRHKK